MTTGERISQRRKELGISADDLADAIGVSRSTIFRYENGYIEKVPMSNLAPIAQALHTTVEYLMGWDGTDDEADWVKNFRYNLGEILKNSDISDISASVDKKRLEAIAFGESPILLADACEIADELGESLDFMAGLDKIVNFSELKNGSQEDGVFHDRRMVRKYRTLDQYGKEAVDAVLEAEYKRMTKIISPTQSGWVSYINCYDLAVSAGTGEPWADQGYKTWLEIPTTQVPEKTSYCARVNGNSMEPAYKDGDIVFVQQLDGEQLREGEIGIFRLNSEGYIKQLGYHELISLNPAYGPIAIHEYDDFEVQGRVLGKL